MIQSPNTPLYREQTGTCLVEIYDSGETRSLYFGGRFLQSRISLSAPHLLLLPYTQYMMFSLLLTRDLRRVLLVGLGAGSLVRFLHHHFPACSIDAVDNSPQVIKLAKGYFQLRENLHVHIYCQDGQQFLTAPRSGDRYDLILIDAFDEQGMSAHIYDTPFFQLCADALQPGGVLCCNLWSGASETVEQIAASLAGCFPGRLLLPVPGRGNVICIATAAPLEWDRICRRRNELRRMRERYDLNFHKMVQVALQHNMSFGQRLRRFFTL
jgi:spermidine synthase